MRQLWLQTDFKAETKSECLFNLDENTNGAHPQIFLTLPKTSHNLRGSLAHHQLKFLEFTSWHGSQLKISSCRPQRRQAGNKEKAIRDEGGVYRKRSTSDLCVPTVATAVSGSAEHKSYQGELCGPTGKTQQRGGKGLCLNKIQFPTVFITSWLGWELFVNTAAKSNFLCRFQHHAFITSVFPHTQTLLGWAAQLYQQQQPKDTRQIILTYNFVCQRHLPTIHLRVDRLLAFILKG